MCGSGELLNRHGQPESIHTHGRSESPSEINAVDSHSTAYLPHTYHPPGPILPSENNDFLGKEDTSAR